MDTTASNPTRTVLFRGCPEGGGPPTRHGPVWPEWTIANGIGGFAMGTALGVNTRRYHGLLVAAIKPPVERAVILSQVADVLRLETTAGEQAVELHCTLFHFVASSKAPMDHPSLESFEHDGIAGEVLWRYRFETPVGVVRVVKSLRLDDGANSCTLRYDVDSPRAWSLELRPLVALRDAHTLSSSDSAESRVLHRELKTAGGEPGVVVSSRELGVQLWTDGGRFETSEQRWNGLEYLWERKRGLDSNESLFSPGRFIASGERSGSVVLRASVQASEVVTGSAGTRGARVNGLIEHVLSACPGAEPEDRERLARLAAATDLFVVRRGQAHGGVGGDGGDGGVSVIAGYPWFTDWGRDTMISLPGLLLATGRHDEARRTLVTFAWARRRGLIPNHFDDVGGAAHFNTVDASLWFVHACGEYVNATGDRETFERELLGACDEIVAAYTDGTDYHIGTDPEDGLIVAGDAKTQLTWMDARRDGVTFTPRFGKAVEINALWHHALRTLAGLIREPERGDELEAQAARVGRSFEKLFEDGPGGGLFDRAEPSAEGWARPNELRPNQVFAASLSRGPLDAAGRRKVVDAVGGTLVTTAGLRTLGASDAAYRPRFEGDLFERDGAYHNGTVWPWLIGAYAEAVLRAGGFSEASREAARAVLRPVIDRLGVDSVGSVPEVYDADEPRRPDGCMAQAWSVAEPLRALMLTYAE